MLLYMVMPLRMLSLQRAAREYVEATSTYRDNRVTVESDRTLRRAAVSDFFRSLDDLDWHQFDCMRQAVGATRDHYAAMHDFVAKNWHAMRQPRLDDGMPLVY